MFSPPLKGVGGMFSPPLKGVGGMFSPPLKGVGGMLFFYLHPPYPPQGGKLGRNALKPYCPKAFFNALVVV